MSVTHRCEKQEPLGSLCSLWCVMQMDSLSFLFADSGPDAYAHTSLSLSGFGKIFCAAGAALLCSLHTHKFWHFFRLRIQYRFLLIWGCLDEVLCRDDRE